MAVARQQGHQVHLLDRYVDPALTIGTDLLNDRRIDMVGIQINTVCSRDAFQLIHELDRKRRAGEWRGKIVAGGPHVSVRPGTIPECVDHLVIGEGEEALLDILNGRAQERILRARRLTDLDALPFQPWDIFSAFGYDDSCQWLDEKPVFTMNTSRGCPFHCRFCSVGSVWGRSYSSFSARRVADEVEFLVRRYAANGIYFREDNFTLNEKRTREFCELLLRKDLSVSWACETRVDTLSRDLVALMAKAGCRAFYFGIESGSQRVLDHLGKGITVQQIVDALTWSRTAGIRAYCSLLAGVPGETFTDLRRTVSLMKTLRPFQYTFNVFVGLPDSSLYSEIRQARWHEHEDDIGLLYPPGFDVKARFFYGRDSADLVDHRFRRRTWYDRQLQAARLWIRIRQGARAWLGRWARVSPPAR
jgi:radical SAM superfamily enzyme YgiQ (UPF0313 family)